MIEATTLVEKSSKSPLQSLLLEPRNEHQEALERFAAAKPPAANAIVGVRVSTAGLAGGDGGAYLAITYIGTPVVLETIPAE